jgi:metal-dependent amidase/aminoacylase/carboxypeptidase family protein
VRARTDEELVHLKDKVVKCFEGAASSTGCKYAITERLHYKGLRVFCKLTIDLKVNGPLAMRYEWYASRFGIKFRSRREQESSAASASSDQGNVSYEIPAMQAVYKIDVPSGDANHTPGFADVFSRLTLINVNLGSQKHRGSCQNNYEFESSNLCRR